MKININFINIKLLTTEFMEVSSYKLSSLCMELCDVNDVINTIKNIKKDITHSLLKKNINTKIIKKS
jgi:hypothetical protein